MDIQAIQSLTKHEMQTVNQCIIKALYSEVELIEEIGHYIVENGGKRFRPMVTLLSAKALGYQGEVHYQLAVIIEFIHTATLLHDDVVDESDVRRSQKTANAVWGNATSILVGDFLYSRAFEMMVATNEMAVMDIMSKATNRIAEGEVLQLLHCHNAETTEEKYNTVIDRKTATLFTAATQLGGVAAQASKSQMKALSDYGQQLGFAFQILDDLIDYSDSSTDIGKNVGDDLAEGKPTLPLIRALQKADKNQQSYLKKAIESGSLDMIDNVIEIIHSTDAIAYTRKRAEKATELAVNAIQQLPASEYRRALVGLAEHGLKRTF